jgi:hypothetical protein
VLGSFQHMTKEMLSEGSCCSLVKHTLGGKLIQMFLSVSNKEAKTLMKNNRYSSKWGERTTWLHKEMITISLLYNFIFAFPFQGVVITSLPCRLYCDFLGTSVVCHCFLTVSVSYQGKIAHVFLDIASHNFAILYRPH